MHKFRINFAGLFLFVREQGDATVHVRSITGSHGHGHGHSPHFSHLAIPTHVPVTESDDGPLHPGRGAGRPFHLYMFDTLALMIDRRPLSGPVTVQGRGYPPPPHPTTASDWSHFDFVMDAAHVFPEGRLDDGLLNEHAPHGRLALNGGVLRAAVPLTQLGDAPWHWFRDGAQVRESYITDHTVFEVEVEPSKTITLILTVKAHDGTVLTHTVELRPLADTDVWFTNDPFDLARRDARPEKMEHLDMYQACFLRALDPPDIRPAPGFMTPKSGTCASLQVRR